MSRSPRDYEYATYHHEPYRNLPPIRDVFGDVLGQPARLRSAPDNLNYHAYSSGHHPHKDAHHTEPQLPPLRSRSDTPTKSSQATANHPWGDSRPSFFQNSYVKAPRQESQNHSYDVFVSTSTQGLVHQRSSNKDDFRQAAKEEAISSSTGKHACPDCGRRFEKLSHFKNHMNSHSGEKPYQCPWPGCGKTFSASSNMRRHERSHGNVDDARKYNTRESEATQSRWDSKRHSNSQSFYH